MTVEKQIVGCDILCVTVLLDVLPRLVVLEAELVNLLNQIVVDRDVVSLQKQRLGHELPNLSKLE